MIIMLLIEWSDLSKGYMLSKIAVSCPPHSLSDILLKGSDDLASCVKTVHIASSLVG